MAITPLEMKFQILYISGNGEMHEGQIIQYQLNVLPFTKSNWVTEIKHVDPRNSFTDEQRFGPYKFWHHQHRFIECADGVDVIDEVSYALPFGYLGEMAQSLFVKKELSRIFDFRSGKLREHFNK